MITMFNEKSLYFGNDMKRFEEIRTYLETNKIKYKYKVRWAGDMVHRGTLSRGRYVGPENDSEKLYEYEILVSKKDFERIKL